MNNDENNEEKMVTPRSIANAKELKKLMLVKIHIISHVIQ